MEARTPIYAGIRFFQNIVFRADLFFQIFQFGKIPPKRFIYGNNFFAKFPRKYFACHAWKNSVHVIGVCGKTYMHHGMHGIPHGTLPVGWIVFWGFTFRTLFGLAVYHMGIYVFMACMGFVPLGDALQAVFPWACDGI